MRVWMFPRGVYAPPYVAPHSNAHAHRWHVAMSRPRGSQDDFALLGLSPDDAYRTKLCSRGLGPSDISSPSGWRARRTESVCDSAVRHAKAALKKQLTPQQTADFWRTKQPSMPAGGCSFSHRCNPSPRKSRRSVEHGCASWARAHAAAVERQLQAHVDSLATMQRNLRSGRRLCRAQPRGYGRQQMPRRQWRRRRSYRQCP